MIQYSKIEKFLRHRDFILCVAIFSVIWLTPNTYWVAHSLLKTYAPFWRELTAAGAAILVASGIMIYTLHGDMKRANAYMWFEIGISSYYYIITLCSEGWDSSIIPAFMFVFMLPISLKNYTSLLNKDKEEATNKQDEVKDSEIITSLQEDINDLHKERIDLQAQVIKGDIIIEEYKANYQDLLDKYTANLKASESVVIEQPTLQALSEPELLKMADHNLPDHLFD